MSTLRYLDTWERAQAQLIRLIALGLDALVDQATPLGEEEYRVALEDGARRSLGLVPQKSSSYPNAVEAVIEKVLQEWKEQNLLSQGRFDERCRDSA